MPVFELNIPVVTDNWSVEVDALPPGIHKFELIVEDEGGNRSVADYATVTVKSAAPVITAVVPGYGVAGSRVVIQGDNFDPVADNNTVTFNRVPAEITTVADGALTAAVPSGATTGFISVQTALGSGNSPSPFIVPRSFSVMVGPAPVDLAHDPVADAVWVVNSGAVEGNRGTISLVGLKERKVLATILVGNSPREIALSTNREIRRALVSNAGESSASLMDMNKRRVITTVSLPGKPLGCAISPDGRLGLMVIAGDSSTRRGSVAVIDMQKLQVASIIPVGLLPNRVLFSVDGNEAYVNCTGEGSVMVLDIAGRMVSDSIKVGGAAQSSPQEIALTPSSYPFLTANSGNQTVSMVSGGHKVTDIPLKITPGGVAASPVANQAYFAGGKDPAFAVVNFNVSAMTAKYIRTVGVGGGVKGIALTPDGQLIGIVHPEKVSLSVFAAKELHLLATVATPAAPIRTISDSKGEYFCAVCNKENSLVVVELASLKPA